MPRRDGDEPDTEEPRLLARLVGALPATLTIIHLWQYHVPLGNPGAALWLCHVSNVLVSAGVVMWIPWVIRPASLWMFGGLPLWLLEMTRTGIVLPTSIVAHLSGLALAIWAVRRVGMTRWNWLMAFGLYLVCQQAARMWSPAESNINLAHRVDPAWVGVFPGYASFWLVASALAGGGLWLIERLFLRLAPAGEHHAA